MIVTLAYIRETFDHLVIPCSSVKKEEPSPAQDFYCGKGYFLHQKRLCEQALIPFSILSSKYGLIPPDYLCSPYDLIWSRAVQQDNASMRGRIIPIATEEHRQQVAATALAALQGKRVLYFCSLHYQRYFPGWVFFNALVGEGRPSNKRGIQYIVSELHRLGNPNGA